MTDSVARIFCNCKFPTGFGAEKRERGGGRERKIGARHKLLEYLNNKNHTVL